MSYIELATEAIMKAYNGGSKSITPKKIHPDYENQKDVDVWEEINKVAYKLQEEGFVTIKKTVKSKSMFAQSDDIQKIVFIQENMADFADKYGQKEKKAFLKELEEMLIPYTESEHETIAMFAKEQLEIVRSGKNPKYVQKQNATNLLNCLKAAVGMMNQTEDIMVREFSQDVQLLL